MTIRDPRRLKKVAAHRLENAPDAGKLVLIYSGVLTASALLVSVVSHLLGNQISQSGGLSNLGTRSLLSSFQSFLPMVQSLLMLAVEFGYIAAMLRISRSQYTSPSAMKMGFERFWLLLRATLLQSMFYFAACFGGFYLATLVYSLTPLSRPAVELLTPLMENYTDPASLVAAMDTATQLRLMEVSVPLLLLSLVGCLAFLIPVFYQYRMVNYVIVDKPGCSAMYALRESKAMMRGNKLRLFRMDLSYWWYHGLLMLASVLCYGDLLLPMLGIALPFSPTVSYYLFYVLFLALQVGIYWKFRNGVEVSYALAYDSIRPQEKPQEGAVLGNIFQM